MATSGRRPAAALDQTLFAEPYRFQFFQAVRLLRRIADTRRGGGGGTTARPIEPLDEIVRLRAALSLAFPIAEIDELEPGEEGSPPAMAVTFLGLHGPSGVLPRHYSELVSQQVRRKSPALRDLFDIFNHRAAIMHFLAWRKYRLAAEFEIGPRDEDDPITAALYALVGFGTGGLRGRLAVEDEVLIHYGGLFAQSARSAVGLELLLSDYIGRPVRISQFVGRWAPLPAEDCTSLATAARPFGNFAALGVNAVAGTRVWDVQGGFRVSLGPLDYKQFAELMPGAPLMNEIAALTRTYAGPGLAFDVELVLRGEEVPDCTFTESGAFLPRLGWNTWLHTEKRPPTVSDAVIRYTGI
jgi:type VI secretion system protein ImpH